MDVDSGNVFALAEKLLKHQQLVFVLGIILRDIPQIT